MTPRGAYMGLNVYNMIPRGDIHGVKFILYDPKSGMYGVKCICNGVNVYVIMGVLIKGPHMNV
jgi:hypothetical protein